MSQHDPIDKLIVLPHFSIEFVSGMVWAHSKDPRGEVHFVIRSNDGRPYYKFVREHIDPAIPNILRK